MLLKTGAAKHVLCRSCDPIVDRLSDWGSQPIERRRQQVGQPLLQVEPVDDLVRDSRSERIDDLWIRCGVGDDTDEFVSNQRRLVRPAGDGSRGECQARE